MDATVWRVDATEYSGSGHLSVRELDRAARMRQESQQRTWMAVRSALRRVLSSAVGCEPHHVEFQKNSYGKPYLAGHGHPGGLRFNVSHSGNFGLIAVARGIDVGVDIEEVPEDLDPRAIYAQTLCPAEVEVLESTDPAEQHLAFYRIWTRKEAAVKAVGHGLSIPLDSFSALPERVAPLNVRLVNLVVPEGYVGALGYTWTEQPMIVSVRRFSEQAFPAWRAAGSQ